MGSNTTFDDAVCEFAVESLTRTFATIAASSRRSARVESRSLPRFEMTPW